jgi:CTP synthase
VADFARQKDIPYLGICFGFQLAIVAFARHVCTMKEANSTELNPDTPYPVVDFMPEQRSLQEMGGTMRLGAHEIMIQPKTNAFAYYGSTKITRRHRHRYEFNQKFKNEFDKAGLIFSAHSDSGRRTEILELPNLKFYFGIQYHGEFSSRPGNPERAFGSFVKACAKVKT